LVLLADGSSIPIEDVQVGAQLQGAFGEINTVLALHRPLLGDNTMSRINDEHSTSSHHPHIGPNKQFFAVKPHVAIEKTYGRAHEVIDATGVIVERFLDGLAPARILPLSCGAELLKVEGPTIVRRLETFEMAPDTQLYNLVMSGSHTYFVDGYCVTGWPSEKDFDYDEWMPRI
jgi:hypothetical protein